MTQYVNVRVYKSSDGKEWLVCGQNSLSYKWDVLHFYPVDMAFSKDVAKTYACVLAQDFSKRVNQLVTAFDDNWRTIHSFMGGKIFYVDIS